MKADALRSQVETASKAIALETERGGCKSKCEGKMRDRDALNERIGKIEQVADLTKRIEATQRILDDKTNVAAKTEYKSSAVVNQTNVAAQLYLAMTGETPEKAIDPDKVTFSFVNIFIAGAGSLAFMIMAPVGFFVSGRNRRDDAISITREMRKDGTIVLKETHTKTNNIIDPGLSRAIVNAMQNSRLAQRGLAA